MLKNGCSLRSLSSLLVLALLAGPSVALAQQSQTQTLSVTTRLVLLDVVVTDKQGHPVTDLKRDDFEIYEDNVLQRVRTFEAPSEHALPPAVASAPDAASQVFDPAKPANFGQSPVTILVLDQLNTHFADSSFARREVQSFLAKQQPVMSQPATLLTVYQNKFKELAPFTRDRAKLEHALEKAPVEYPWTLEVNGAADHGPMERLEATLTALEEIAQTYSRIPGRKNLIWVGSGFPSLDPTNIAAADDNEMKDAVRHVTDTLLDAHITLYAVDPTTTAMGMTEIIDPMQMMFVMANGGASSGSIDPVNNGGDFDTLGQLTGGRVIRSMNNVAAQLQASVDFGANYYTLGYSPTNPSSDSLKFRNIRVTTNRPGLFVSTRTGYYVGKAISESAHEAIAYDLSTAAESPLPLNALHVTAELNTSVAVLNDAWIIHVAAPGLTWTQQQDGTSKASIAVMAVSLNKQGKMIAHALQAQSAYARPGVNVHDDAKTANFNFEATPAPKAVTLRFIVRDSSSGRMGSFDLPLKQ